MKKALGQTVRDLKRGMNKKVLKVPSVEQKILDATSNEAWGPHGSTLADIAQSTRNYHEYQMIMSVIWKRINDTGKNWRHVYKALIVLEYLVAHGSERVIDEIREHAYQISALSDFQYIDSSGRDQGSNVRKKSQSLVVLVNDKERIEEVRQKAAANRDKYHNTSMGGMNRPGFYSSVGGDGERYDDDRYEGRYGSRDEDRNGYEREREWGSRDDDRYGKYGDSNSRDGDRYGRESEEHYGRDGYRDDDFRGRSRSVDDYNFRDRDHSYEDDGQYSSRGNGAKADDLSQDRSVAGRPLDRKYSEQNIVAPPSYEAAVGEARSPTHSERDGETSAASVPKLSSPPLNTSYQETTFSSTPAPAPAPALDPETKDFDGFDEFDPRGSFSAAPISSNRAEMDFLGTLPESFSSNSLAIVSTTTATATLEADAFTNSGFGNGFPSESTASNQPFEDPFGDSPFRAISYTDGFPTQLEHVDSTSSFHSNTNHSEPQPPQPTTQNVETFSNFGFGDTDILADILPPSRPSATEYSAQTLQPALQTDFQGQINQPGSMTGFHGQPDQSSSHTSFPVQIGEPSSMTGFPAHAGQPAPQAGFPHQSDQSASHTGFLPQLGTVEQSGFPAPIQPSQPGANFYGSFSQQSGSTTPGVQPMAPQIPTGPSAQYNTTYIIQQSGSQMDPQMQQAGFSAAMTSAPAPPASSNSLVIVPQPVKDKFETKSTVWADTLQPALQTDFQGQINQPRSMTGFHGQPDQSSSHTSFPVQIGEPSSMTGFPAHAGQPALQAGFPHKSDQPASLTGFLPQMGTVQQSGFPAPNQPSQPGANFYGSFSQQSGSTAPGVQPMAPQIPTGPSAQYNTTYFIQQSGSQMDPQMQQAGFSAAMTSAPAPPASSNPLAIVPQPVKDKFETKSTVWADTLNRGLVNLNISGSKTNPLADIGVDFDAINRKERRMEKPSQTTVVSTITMGKAMGSGSGIGRAGAGVLRGAPNPIMGSGIHMGMGGAPGAGMGMGGAPGGVGMGMGGAPGAGMGMGMGGAGMGMGGLPGMAMGGGHGGGMGMGAGYGVNQPMGGMGMGMNMGMGAGMNMGMGQGIQMQQLPTGFPPGSTMPGGYNPMMGIGNFHQQPYNGGYR